LVPARPEWTHPTSLLGKNFVMTTSRSCRPTLLDQMIALVAIAAALALYRSSHAPPLAQWGDRWLFGSLIFVAELLATTSLALLTIRLTTLPREGRVLLHQPGFTAPAIASSMTVVFAAVFLAMGPSAHTGFYPLCEVFPLLRWLFAGVAVGAGWVLQAWFACWHPERTWLDRAGRAIGVLWLLGPGLAFLMLLVERFQRVRL
jgi:hypothetical protein